MYIGSVEVLSIIMTKIGKSRFASIIGRKFSTVELEN